MLYVTPLYYSPQNMHIFEWLKERDLDNGKWFPIIKLYFDTPELEYEFMITFPEIISTRQKVIDELSKNDVFGGFSNISYYGCVT